MRGTNKHNTGLHRIMATARCVALMLALTGSAISTPALTQARLTDSLDTGQTAEAINQACINFNDLAAGTHYALKDTFVSNGQTITARALDFFTANPLFGDVSVQNTNSAHGTGPEMMLTVADISISYTQPISGLSILYGDFGNVVNLVINDAATSGMDISDMDGIVRDGVTVEVFEDPSTLFGRIILRGNIQPLAIGGSGFRVDDICQLPPLLANVSDRRRKVHWSTSASLRP